MKIPNWLIRETVLNGGGGLNSAILIYISIMRRASPMMDGMYVATLSVNDITDDWDWANLSFGDGYISFDFFLDIFNDIVARHTILHAPDSNEMANGGHHTYKIKAINGCFGPRHDVYLTNQEVYQLVHNSAPRRDCAVALLCYVRYKMHAITDWKYKAIVLGKSTIERDTNIDRRDINGAIRFLERCRMLDLYEMPASEKDQKSSEYYNPHIPVYSIPGVTSSSHIEKCAQRFLDAMRKENEESDKVKETEEMEGQNDQPQ